MLRAIFISKFVLWRQFYTINYFKKLSSLNSVGAKKADNIINEDRYPNPNYSLPPREEFKKLSDAIVANRLSEELLAINEKVD